MWCSFIIPLQIEVGIYGTSFFEVVENLGNLEFWFWSWLTLKSNLKSKVFLGGDFLESLLKTEKKILESWNSGFGAGFAFQIRYRT